MRGRGWVRRSTATSLRSTRSSTSLVDDVRAISRSSPSTCQKIKYSNRNDTSGSCPTKDHRWSAPQARLLAPHNRSRSRSTTIGTDLATVPGRAGPRDPRDRLRPRRHSLPASPLRPDRDRARAPPRAPHRDHRPSDRGLGHPTGPQPPHGSRQPRRPVPVLDPRPRQQVHHRVRRRVHRRGHPHHQHPGPGTPRERDRGTLHRHPAPRMPRPPPDHRNPPPHCSAAGVHQPLQRASSSPIAASAPARRRHAATFRGGQRRASTRPAGRPHTRIHAGRTHR